MFLLFVCGTPCEQTVTDLRTNATTWHAGPDVVITATLAGSTVFHVAPA